MNQFEIFEILIWSFGFVILALVWLTAPSIGLEFVPTIVNGLATSISLIVAFTGASITFGITNEMTGKNVDRLITTVVLLGIPIGVLVITYYFLINSQYYLSIKLAMTGLVVALDLLLDFLGFFASRNRIAEKMLHSYVDKVKRQLK